MTPRRTRVFSAWELKFLLVLVGLLLPSIMLLVSCGGGSSKMNSGATPNSPTTSPTPGSSPPGGGTGGSGGGTGSGSGGGTSGSSTGGTSGGTSGSGGSTGGTTGGGPGGSTGGSTGGVASDQTLKTEDVASGLDNPWSLAFAPDGRLFFTEQPGRLRVIDKTGLVAQPIFDITGQNAGGEAGLTGMDLDPSFGSNGFIYVHYCVFQGKGALNCQVARLIATGNSARLDKVLFDYVSVLPDHTGGRLKVGPDHLLYLGTGDHQNQQSSQDLNSLSGKILRMNLDGTPAAGNPFPTAPYVYALGLRDPQGLAWDSSGQLYGTDHGPISNDEVNIILAGKNYGWPNCIGICNNPNYVDPVKLFTPQTIPPSGAAFYHGSTIPGWDGSMLFAVLGLGNNNDAHHVHRLKFDRAGGTTVVDEQILWQNKFGRIRDVAEGPDGFLYFTTSNVDTSVCCKAGDDRVIRAHP